MLNVGVLFKPGTFHLEFDFVDQSRASELELRNLETPILPIPTPDTRSTLIENTITDSVGHGPLPEQDSNSI